MSVSRYFFRVSRAVPRHPKFRELTDDHGRAGLAAVGLWALAGAVATTVDPPGTVSEADLRRLLVGDPRGAELVDLLAEAGLLDPIEGGWAIHDFAEAHKTGGRRRTELHAKRAAGGGSA